MFDGFDTDILQGTSISKMNTKKPNATSSARSSGKSFVRTPAGGRIGIKDNARFITLKKDTRIFSEGEPRDVAYLIDTGEVDIYENNKQGEEIQVCRLKPGEIFGEMALIEKGGRTASAIAASDTHLLVISPEMLQERITGLDPVVGLLLSILVDRYRRARLMASASLTAETTKSEMDNPANPKTGEPAQTNIPGTFSSTNLFPESLGGTMGGTMGETTKKTTEDNVKDATGKIIGETIGENIDTRSIIKAPEDALHELKIEEELRQAVAEKQLFPALQPIVRLRDRKICGFEALVRWKHPTKGIIPPDHFIPVAERSGIITDIDRLMLEYAAEFSPQINEAAGDPNGDIYIGVNLSGVNFENMEMVESVADICSRQGAVPAQIRLEITESAFISEPDMAESILNAFKALGVTIALDDFGTGFSSLNYLHKFSIDTLKIDQTFVQQLHLQSKSLDIVRAIVGLAQTFRMSVVAEGIEHDDEILALAGVGCEFGQGYLFSRPVPFEEALKILREDSLRKRSA